MPEFPLSSVDYQDLFEQEANAFVKAYLRANLDEIVPNCPEWNVAQLGAHIGSIYHRIAELIHTHSLEPLDPEDFPAPADPREVLGYCQEGMNRLSEAFIGLDPTAPIWTYAGVLPSLFWMRRMTHETMVHAFDLDEIHPPMHNPVTRATADGIDEFFSAQLARKLARQSVPGLSGRLALMATDSSDRWVVELYPDHLEIISDDSLSDAELSGRAHDLLMYLWRRGFASSLDKSGDLDLIATYYRDVRL